MNITPLERTTRAPKKTCVTCESRIEKNGASYCKVDGKMLHPMLVEKPYQECPIEIEKEEGNEMRRTMKTWAEKLEDALPNAENGILWILMLKCPHTLFGRYAPECIGEPLHADSDGCKACWHSCDNKCRYITTVTEDENE